MANVATRSSHVFLVFFFFLIASMIATGLGASPSAHAADVRYHFFTDAYEGRAYTYDIFSSGSIRQTAANQSQEGGRFELSGVVRITFGHIENGHIPIEVSFEEARITGISSEVASVLTERSFRGSMTDYGALLSIETPPILEDQGLDMTDLLIGLVVPAPMRVGLMGDTWSRQLLRNDPAQGAVRSPELRVTYSADGLTEWGRRELARVTGRVRGTSDVRQDGITTRVQEIAHALFYLTPRTGVVDASSVSLITVIDVAGAMGGDISTRIDLTTTLELVGTETTPAASTPSAKPQTDPVTELPSETPDQVQIEPSTDAPATSTEPSDAIETPGDRSEDIPAEESVDTLEDLTEEHPFEEEMHEESIEVTRSEEAPLPEILYVDPAGRFRLSLPGTWSPETSLSLRLTEFVSQSSSERAFVHVRPLPSPSASARAVAQSALTAYGETLNGFRVLGELEEITLDGETAFRAWYQYQGDAGLMTEGGVFTRKGDRAFYLQYGREGDHDRALLLPTLQRMVESFRFGQTPSGAVPSELLQSSLIPYEDTGGRYRVVVPSLWPITEQAEDGSSVTFTEIGENGYFTVLAQKGAQGLPVDQIVGAWKTEWSKEVGFELVEDLQPYTFASLPGVTFTYTWDGGAAGSWTRSLYAITYGDYLYALAFDYTSEGFEARSKIFETMVDSFTLTELEPAEPSEPAEPALPADDAIQDDMTSSTEPETTTPTDDATTIPPIREPDVGGVVVESVRPVADPESDARVILLGRFITRYTGPDGQAIEVGAADTQVVLYAGPQEFRTQTDDKGFFVIENLPRLSGSELYSIAEIEGQVFGFEGPVVVTFDNLQANRVGTRVSDLKTVVLTLHADRTLSVDVVESLPSEAPGMTTLERFLSLYPNSGWADDVQDALMTISQ